MATNTPTKPQAPAYHAGEMVSAKYLIVFKSDYIWTAYEGAADMSDNEIYAKGRVLPKAEALSLPIAPTDKQTRYSEFR